MTLSAVLIDDEPLALRRLELALANIADLKIVGTASDGVGAEAIIRQTKPDLIFVDIQMPRVSGIEFVEALELEYMPTVIFVTAYDQFAIDAFNSGAVDYLLKPIDPQRLAESIKRARTARLSFNAAEKLERLRETISRLKREREAEPADRFDSELWITSRGQSLRVPVRDVRSIEAAGDYVSVYTKEAVHLHFDSLRSLEERLDPRRFLRVHRSVIAALPFIESVKRSSYGRLTLCFDNGRTAKCSRSGKAGLLEKLGL